MQRDLSKLKNTKKSKSGTEGSSTEQDGGSGTTSGAAGGGQGEEADMLEMTLSMLRCSVCKDRFKSCAITRQVVGSSSVCIVYVQSGRLCNTVEWEQQQCMYKVVVMYIVCI